MLKNALLIKQGHHVPKATATSCDQYSGQREGRHKPAVETLSKTVCSTIPNTSQL